MKYKVNRFDLNLKRDQNKLELFLNNLTGEVVAIIPNVAFKAFWVQQINFLLIVENVV